MSVDRGVWPEPETRLDIAKRKLRDYRGGAVLSDAEADALLAELERLDKVRDHLSAELALYGGKLYDAAERLAKVPALVEAYRTLHNRVCDDYWADDECACGGRQLLAAWEAKG